MYWLVFQVKKNAIRIHLFSSTYPVQCCGDGYPSSYRARERAKPCTGHQSTAGTAQRDRPFMLVFTPLNFDLPVNLTCVCFRMGRTCKLHSERPQQTGGFKYIQFQQVSSLSQRFIMTCMGITSKPNKHVFTLW